MTPDSGPPVFDLEGLFVRARAGDQAAWEALFRACFPRVVRVGCRIPDPSMHLSLDSALFASEVMKSLAARLDFSSFDLFTASLAQMKRPSKEVIDEYRRRHPDAG
jgi:hypothetical protein